MKSKKFVLFMGMGFLFGGMATSSALASSNSPAATPTQYFTMTSFKPTPYFYIETGNSKYRSVYKTAFNKWNQEFDKNHISAHFRYKNSTNKNTKVAKHEYTVSVLSAKKDTRIEWNVLGALESSMFSSGNNGQNSQDKNNPYSPGSFRHVWINSASVGFSKNQNVKWRLARATLVAEHELGHVLGLGHNSSGEETIMSAYGSAYYRTSKKGVMGQLKAVNNYGAVMRIGKSYYPKMVWNKRTKTLVSNDSKGAIYLRTFGKKKRVVWNTHSKLGKRVYYLNVVKSKRKLNPEYISKYDLAGVKQNVQMKSVAGSVKAASADAFYRWDKNTHSVISFDFKEGYPINKLNNSASVIVTGIVTSAKSGKSKYFPTTVHGLNINKLYKNKAHISASSIIFNQMGNKETAVSQSALLRKETHVLLFLRKGENGTFNLINEGTSIYVKNMSSGKYVNAMDSHQYSISSIVK